MLQVEEGYPPINLSNVHYTVNSTAEIVHVQDVCFLLKGDVPCKVPVGDTPRGSTQLGVGELLIKVSGGGRSDVQHKYQLVTYIPIHQAASVLIDTAAQCLGSDLY